MIEKINISKIVIDHISTFKDYSTGKYNFADFFLFFLFPFLIAGILTYFNVVLSENIVNVLVTSLSIFAALLFNLLLLIYDIIQKPDDTNNIRKLKKNFLKEIYSNISFCILIAIITVILLLISFLNFDNQQIEFIYQQSNIFSCIITFFIYYFVMLFIFTLLMILKRVHVLLSKEFER